MSRSFRSHVRLLLLAIGGALTVASCRDESESLTGPMKGEPPRVISDAPRGGRAGFYFLPPMIPPPKTLGTPTGAFVEQARVEVCDLGTSLPNAGSSCTGKPIVASFTKTAGTAGNLLTYDPSAGLYQVNWNTDLSVGGDIKPDHYYRVQVWLSGPVLLGYADLDPIKNGSEMKNPTTGTLIPLVSGRTLPIKFRLEAGVATPLDESGGNVTAAAGAVQLAFPEGALTSDVSVVVASAPSNAYPSDGSAVPGTLYEFQPSPISFAEPVQLTLTYPATLPAGTRRRGSSRDASG